MRENICGYLEDAYDPIIDQYLVDQGRTHGRVCASGSSSSSGRHESSSSEYGQILMCGYVPGLEYGKAGVCVVVGVVLRAKGAWQVWASAGAGAAHEGQWHGPSREAPESSI